MAFAGFDVPLQMDVPAEKMIMGVQGIDASRRERLIKVTQHLFIPSFFLLFSLKPSMMLKKIFIHSTIY